MGSYIKYKGQKLRSWEHIQLYIIVPINSYIGFLYNLFLTILLLYKNIGEKTADESYIGFLYNFFIGNLAPIQEYRSKTAHESYIGFLYNFFYFFYQNMEQDTRIYNYIGYRDKTFIPVTNIGTQKVVYICHRNSAAPRSCDIYRPLFSFLYLSQELNFYPYIPYIVIYYSVY